MTDDMTAQQAAALREPFPPEAIGKLPKAGTQLDYVGHAAVTDRLLKVDPGWSWEPFALAEDGGPLIRRGANDAELWIRLTVCGMTRPGVGTAPLKAFDLPKQLISDAIRNAAMRFGVALDLWAKEDLHSEPPVEPASEAQLDTIRTAIEALAEGRRSELSETWKQRGYGSLTGQPFPLAASDAPAVLALITELQAKADGTVDETGQPLTDEPF